MSAHAERLTGAAATSRLEDYWSLGKPRVVGLIAFTTAAGYWLGAEGAVDPVRLLLTLVGTAFAAAGSLGLNMLFERDLDARMDRTADRPLPGGRLTPLQAAVFGVVAVLLGLAVLTLAVEPLAGLITAVTVLTYLFAYTPLKRVSAICTVVGAFPGALPPLTGWAAASGRLTVGAWALFGIFFFWQLPHSLAIARLYRDDYRRAGIRVLPAVDDGPATGRQAVLHSLGLVAAGAMPFAVGLSGVASMAVALALGTLLLGLSIAMLRENSQASARRLFVWSLLYVPVILVALGLDKR